MPVPELPTEIHSLILRFVRDQCWDEYVRDSDLTPDLLPVDSANHHLLNTALVCKRFADVMIPLMYQRISVAKIDQVLFPLAKRLLQEPLLARTVRAIRFFDGGDEGNGSESSAEHDDDSGEEDADVEDFDDADLEGDGEVDDKDGDVDMDEEQTPNLSTYSKSKRKHYTPSDLPSSIDFVSFDGAKTYHYDSSQMEAKWGWNQQYAEHLVGIILNCCPYLCEMYLLETEDFPPGTSWYEIFYPEFWPWKQVECIQIARQPPEEETMEEPHSEYGEQLIQSSDAWPDGMKLPLLRLVEFQSQGIIYGAPLQPKLPVTRLEIIDLCSCSLGHGWSHVLAYISHCTGLEHVQVDLKNSLSGESLLMSWQVPLLYRALCVHSATLKTLDIALPVPPAGENDETGWPATVAYEEPTPDSVHSFKMFDKLEDIRMHMPLLFGELFFLKLPIVVNNDSSEAGFRMDLPTPGFGETFREVLGNHLPPSLKRLTMWYDEVFQEQALEAAVGWLREARPLPLLEKIEVLDIHEVYPASAFQGDDLSSDDGLMPRLAFDPSAFDPETGAALR